MSRRGVLNQQGQSIIEFLLIVPILMVILLGIYQVTMLAIKLQRLQMVAHYAARTYSMSTVRGVSAGSEATLQARREEIARSVEERTREYLGQRADVNITGNMVEVILPVKVEVWGVSREFNIRTQAYMEDEPLIYGGGRWE